MSFNTLKGGRSFPIDRAGGGSAQLLPWTAAWGTSTLANLTLGALRADTWNAAGTVAGANTINVFPQRGGVIYGLSIKFVSAAAAAQTTTWTLLINGAVTTLTFNIVPPAQSGEIFIPAGVVLPAAATPYNIEVQWSAAIAPGAATLSPRAFATGLLAA